MKALVECIKDALWIRGFLAEIMLVQEKPTVIFVDNTACMALAESMRNAKNVKHFLLRQELINKTISLKYVPTGMNVPDMLTKPLPVDQFTTLFNYLFRGGFHEYLI